ncbi:MAG: hypothetical protein WC755_08190 [Candidatus Woesearchaeota archaeon]|jgi:hypothetical protein
MKKFISSFCLLAFLSFSAHGSTTYFLYVSGNDSKVAKSVVIDLSLFNSDIILDNSIISSVFESELSETESDVRDVWALHFYENGKIDFFAPKIKLLNKSDAEPPKFQYEIHFIPMFKNAYPNKEESLSLLPIVLEKLLNRKNKNTINNMYASALLQDSNFNKFEDFFSNTKDMDWYKYEGKLDQAILEAKQVLKTVELSQDFTNIIASLLLFVSLVLMMKSIEEASTIIGAISSAILMFPSCYNLFIKWKYEQKILLDSDLIAAVPVKRLISYYVLFGSKEQQEHKIIEIEDILKKRKSHSLSDDLLEKINHNLAVLIK